MPCNSATSASSLVSASSVMKAAFHLILRLTASGSLPSSCIKKCRGVAYDLTNWHAALVIGLRGGWVSRSMARHSAACLQCWLTRSWEERISARTSSVSVGAVRMPPAMLSVARLWTLANLFMIMIALPFLPTFAVSRTVGGVRKISAAYNIRGTVIER